MSHAILIPSFISPVTPPAGDKAVAVSLSFIVSAINSRPLAVYLRMSVFIQYAQRNLSHWLHVLVAPVTSVSRKGKSNGEALQCLTKVLKDLTK